MGSKEDKKKRRSRSPSSSSDDSGSSEGERKRHKKDKKKKKDKDKKHKKSKHKDGGGDDDIVKKAKEFLKQAIAGPSGAAGAAAAAGPVGEPQPKRVSSATAAILALAPSPAVKEPITEDDYFARGNEFSSWLLEERGIYSSDLDTEDAHSIFREFVALWNANRLAPKFYSGLVTAPVRRTTFRWGFDGGAAAAAAAAGGGPAGGALAGATGTAAFMQDQRDRNREAFAAQRQEQRKSARDQRELLDELLPKATGREAKVEARVARREEARARETSPDLAFVPGGSRGLMGGGDDDSFQAAKAREAKRQEMLRMRTVAKQEDAAQKLAQYQAKEDDKMAGFRALLARGPITIAKRTE